MGENDIIELFSSRYLGAKTDNIIFKNVTNFDVFDKIPEVCSITGISNEFGIDKAINVKVDLSLINIHEILSFIIDNLKDRNLIDKSINSDITFNGMIDILKFHTILKRNDVIVQIICKNIECLNDEDSLLFNELYYIHSGFYNITSFAKKDFKNYYLTNDRFIDSRDNFDKYSFIDSYYKVKKPIN